MELDHASQLAELLIEADLRGHYSHGLNRLHVYIEDVIGGINKEGRYFLSDLVVIRLPMNYVRTAFI